MTKISLLVHADWSINPRNRVACYASLQKKNKYYVYAPQPVGDLADFLPRIKKHAGKGNCALVGFDFPIGLPIHYAEIAGIAEYPAFLSKLGKDCWSDFYNVAEIPDDISITRPFYPKRPGSAKQHHLTEALKVKDLNGLRRLCEKRTPSRRAACPIFWTLGPQQVGKAAITGWRDVLSPALVNDSLNLMIWPFSGDLNELIMDDHIILVETYPAEYYSHFSIEFGNNRPGGKQSPSARAYYAPIFRELARKFNVKIDPVLQHQLDNGFNFASSGDDAFDAFVGLMGMLNVIRGNRNPGKPNNNLLTSIEGWIFGQSSLSVQHLTDKISRAKIY